MNLQKFRLPAAIPNSYAQGGFAVALALLVATYPALCEVHPGWPAGVREIFIPSSMDGSKQPAMAYFAPDDGEARPLLVRLHTWSDGYQRATNEAFFARWALQQRWHFVHPHFRGPNQTPQAMGSEFAVRDIVDAVEFMRKAGNVDASRIYLIGSSGGGHMALLMAGRHPEIWAGVSAWVPITDIAAWHKENSSDGNSGTYARKIEGALGGPPDDESRRKEAEKRSPVTWLANAREVPIDINHGIHDGRKGSVPFRHSLMAFNRLASPPDRLQENEIETFYQTQQRPAGWAKPAPDELYEPKTVLFRKISGNARVTIFEGGHEILYIPALNWLAQQKRGHPAVWEVTDPIHLEAGSTESGK